MNDLKILQQVISCKFRKEELLLQALTHRSYVNEHPEYRLGHNERLELLGDAVIELVVTERLFQMFPTEGEGQLTRLRSAIVSGTALTEIGKEWGLGCFLLMSRGQEKEKGVAQERLISDAVEALIGALYLDKGYEAARRFILNRFRSSFDAVSKGVEDDPKSALQCKAQEKRKVTPIYKVLDEEGRDNEKSFVIGVYLGEELIAQGTGTSKAKAEQHAAREALVVLGWLIEV